MKKAKIVLSAVALFAVVGGALAFKAKNFNTGTHWRTTSTTVIAGSTYYYCPAGENFTTTDVQGPTFQIFTSTVQLPNGRTVCTGTPLTSYGTVVAE